MGWKLTVNKIPIFKEILNPKSYQQKNKRTKIKR